MRAALLLLIPAVALAHPLGNVTTNRWAALDVGPERVVVRTVVDMAEIPAFRTLPEADANGDGVLDAAEADAFGARMATALAADLDLRADGARLALVPARHHVEAPPGAGGLRTLRIEADYAATLPPHTTSLAFADRRFFERTGWREIIAGGRDGAVLRTASVPATDRSAALRSYPGDLLADPLDVRTATVTLAPPGTPAATPVAPATVPAPPARGLDALSTLLADPAPLAPATALFALVVAAFLGACHALTPGHGKTIVGAYLVGERGTAAHAVLLGGVVTLTHTLGVYALGAAALVASAWIVPERLMPWFEVASGLLVVAVGASLVRDRLHAASHDHGHDHDGLGHHHHGPGHGHHHHRPAEGPTVRRLVALGVSGGLAPCPSALVVMLGAIALGRTAFGLALVAAFSVGLAGVLVGIGLVLVRARHLFDRLPLDGRVARFAPVASAVVVSLAGLGIVAEAARRIGA